MYVYNPEDFDPKHSLPPSLHAYADCARVLVHHVETARVYHKLQGADFVPRKAQYLRRLVHKEMYLPVRNALLDAGVLDYRPQYIVGKQSYGFRIGERFEDAFFCRHKLTDTAAIRRVRRVRAEQCPPLTDATHKGLSVWLDRLEVDYDKALSYLRSLPLDSNTLRQYQLSLSMLNDKEFFFKPDVYGRVHTNVTNLWRGFRQSLHYQGENLVNVDIGNSQPLFFGMIVMNWVRGVREQSDFNYNSLSLSPPPSPFHYGAENTAASVSVSEVPDDLKQYMRVTERAEFYEVMMERLGIPITKERRNAFKTDFFAKVFYCRSKRYTQERKVFKKVFPTVFEHLTMLKRKNPRNAPLALQRAESEFVIGTACKRILHESPDTPLWTIHDSILTTASRGTLVLKVMEEEFARLGVHPRLRAESLAPQKAVVSAAAGVSRPDPSPSLAA